MPSYIKPDLVKVGAMSRKALPAFIKRYKPEVNAVRLELYPRVIKNGAAGVGSLLLFVVIYGAALQVLSGWIDPHGSFFLTCAAILSWVAVWLLFKLGNLPVFKKCNERDDEIAQLREELAAREEVLHYAYKRLRKE